MSITLPRITRKAIANGKAYRYDNATTGEPVTKRSARLYKFASAYRVTTRRVGFEPVTVKRTNPRDIAAWGPTYESTRPVYEAIPEAEQEITVYLHSRADLAANGSPDANRMADHGHFARIPGVIEIEEV